MRNVTFWRPATQAVASSAKLRSVHFGHPKAVSHKRCVVQAVSSPGTSDGSRSLRCRSGGGSRCLLSRIWATGACIIGQGFWCSSEFGRLEPALVGRGGREIGRGNCWGLAVVDFGSKLCIGAVKHAVCCVGGGGEALWADIVNGWKGR